MHPFLTTCADRIMSSKSTTPFKKKNQNKTEMLSAIPAKIYDIDIRFFEAGL